MSIIFNNLALEGRSKATIEIITENFLKKVYPINLIKPTPLDTLDLLDDKMYQLYGYSIDIVDKYDTEGNSLNDDFSEIESETDFIAKTIQFTPGQYRTLVQGNNRSRFTAAHEAYHIIDHRNQVVNLGLEGVFNQIKLYRIKNREIPAYRSSEWQANYGAGCLLIPKKTLIPFIQKLQSKRIQSINIIWEVMAKYRVSEQVAEKRLKYLNIIK